MVLTVRNHRRTHKCFNRSTTELFSKKAAGTSGVRGECRQRARPFHKHVGTRFSNRDGDSLRICLPEQQTQNQESTECFGEVHGVLLIRILLVRWVMDKQPLAKVLRRWLAMVEYGGFVDQFVII